MAKKRLIRLVIAAICLYLIVTTLQSMGDLIRARDKLTRREKTLADLEKQRDDSLREKRRVESPDYLEKIARDQLNLGKPGEEVIIIPDDLLKDPTPTATPDTRPNWKKWAELFFK